jgi:ATP synthase protein I
MPSWFFFAGLRGRFGRHPGAYEEAAVLTDETRVVPMTLLAQALMSVGLAGLALFWQGKIVAASVLLGGMVAAVPNAFLGARLLNASASAAALMRSAWVGEVGKLVLTAALFAVVFATVRPISAPAVFGGFIAAQLVAFGALLYGSGAGGMKS